MAVTRNFSFDETGDRDLLEYLKKKGNQSEIVREAIRRHMKTDQAQPSLVQVLEAVDELNKKLTELLARSEKKDEQKDLQGSSPGKG